ncbi:MAG: glycosyltransferase [Selenomonadaceae bacterium]|nr:glycosyltransferase [Selenomonadaceae bacterium]
MAIINNPPSTCAVSVIVPMYNAEKYIGECLDSLLNQTFQNFEVILVNDCATDNSRQVAETYLEKFGGRLKIYDNKKNSGVSVTRNRGLLLSRGEYVFFLDSDDIITETALEEMYNLAKKYDADFVNCMKNYKMSEDGKDRKLFSLKKITPNDETLAEEDLNWRFKKLYTGTLGWGPPRKFLRRDFLIENELFFIKNILSAEDKVWTLGILFCAKKMVHAPLALYFYRQSENSITRTKKTFRQKVMLSLTAYFYGLKWIDNIMNQVELFKQNPQYRHEIFKKFANDRFNLLAARTSNVPASNVYETVKNEFRKDFGKHDVLVAELCSLINEQYKEIIRLNEQLNAK